MLKKTDMNESNSCCCAELGDVDVVPMSADGRFERVFASLDRVKQHGGHQWWLYATTCRACGTSWMVAQDERIHDNFYLKRLSPPILRDIIETNQWPEDFLTYEQVLRLGRDSGHVCRFADTRDPALIYTVYDLRRERPYISASEIAHLLAIPVELAAGLLGK